MTMMTTTTLSTTMIRGSSFLPYFRPPTPTHFSIVCMESTFSTRYVMSPSRIFTYVISRISFSWAIMKRDQFRVIVAVVVRSSDSGYDTIAYHVFLFVACGWCPTSGAYNTTESIFNHRAAIMTIDVKT